jgi:hypothetical protein
MKRRDTVRRGGDGHVPPAPPPFVSCDYPQNANDLPEEVVNVTQREITGAGFEPATFGL